MNSRSYSAGHTWDGQQADSVSAHTHGIVLDIQRSTMHDGPGIRTTVFLKGCPLRCQWCHNPESWHLAPQVGSGSCSGRQFGRAMTVEKVLEVVRRDLLFYRASGGGITLSGGEPAFQPDFCAGLLRAAKAEGIHTCLDTSGYFSAATRELLRPWVDLFLFDVKATGEDLHRRLTGVPPQLILDNLRQLLAAGANVWLRCPLVPGINDLPDHLHALAALSRESPQITRLDILPYHRSGIGKWRALGLDALDQAIPEPDEEQKRSWMETLTKSGAMGACFGK